MTTLRYEPARVPLLRRRADAALRHLLRASSGDPAAASALRVATVVQGHLQHGWLPTLDRVLASDAMLTWHTSATLTGSALGASLAEQAIAIAGGAAHDEEAGAEFLAALRAAETDEAALAAFFAAVDPDRFLQVVVTVARHMPATLDVPVALRQTFVTAAWSGGLPPRFAGRLVDAAAEHNASFPGEGGLALSFLFHGDPLPGDLVVASIDALVAGEHRYADERGYDPEYGGAQWDTTQRAGAPALQLEFADAGQAPFDPVYALLGQLARRPAPARDVFTDRDRAAYLFGARDVMADGGAAIVAAAASAGLDVTPDAPDDVRRDAAFVASSFVNHFGSVHAGEVPPDDAVSADIAAILGTHLASVEYALAFSDTGDVPPTDRVEAAELELDGRPPFVGAVLDDRALDAVIRAAARADAGVAALNDALGAYRQATAAHTADGIAAGTIPAAHLAEIVQDAARFDARVVTAVADEARKQGVARDAAVTFWVRLVADGIGLIPRAAAGPLADRLADGAEGRLAGHADAATAEAQLRMLESGTVLAYEWARQLHRAGVVDVSDGLPGYLLRRGELVPFTEALELLAEHRAAVDIGDILQRLDAAGGALLDLETVLEVMGDAGQPLYVPSDD